MSIATVIQNNRDEILREINELEARLNGLRATLPAAFKKFFVFATDKRKIWVYANTREDANAKLRARMNKDYGNGWKVLSKTVDVYTDPQEAANHSPGNLFRSLTRQDGLLLLQDWRANQQGREEKGKNMPRSGFEKDAEAFEMLLKIEAK